MNPAEVHCGCTATSQFIREEAAYVWYGVEGLTEDNGEGCVVSSRIKISFPKRTAFLRSPDPKLLDARLKIVSLHVVDVV